MEVEEDKDSSGKYVTDRNLKYSIQNCDEQKLVSALPATPSRSSRTSVQMPFSAMRKLPQLSLLPIGSSSAHHGGQKLGKPNGDQPLPKVEKHIQAVEANGIPQILRGNLSPINGVKSGSPNSKRVSPPHCDSGSSSPPPSQRTSSRKLILQSIPSFPSLTPKH